MMHKIKMMKKKLISFLGWSFVFILLRVLDLWTTYRSSPELTDEINPVHSIFSGGWIVLLITNIIVCAIILFLYHFYEFRYIPARNVKNTETYMRFLSTLYFGEPGKFHQVAYKMPEDRKILAGQLGYVLMRISVFGSMLAVLNNDLHYHRVPFYERWCAIIVHPAFFIYGAIFLFSIFVFRRITFREYRQNKLHSNT